MIGHETFEDLADPPRCMGLRKPLDGPRCPTLIKCGLASPPSCSASSCPFLAAGRPCPFVKKAAKTRRAGGLQPDGFSLEQPAEEQTSMRFSPEPEVVAHRHGVGNVHRG